MTDYADPHHDPSPNPRQDLETRKRAPLYQKKQEEELRAAAEKAAEAELRAQDAELRCKEAKARRPCICSHTVLLNVLISDVVILFNGTRKVCVSIAKVCNELMPEQKQTAIARSI